MTTITRTIPTALRPGDIANLPTVRAGENHFETRLVCVETWPRQGIAGNISCVVRQVFTGDRMRATMAPDVTITIVG